MRKAVLLCLLLSLPVFFLANQVLASPPAQQTVEVRDDEFEREVIARLTEISPEAVPVFRQATADWDAGNPEAARAGFEAVLELAPGFHDALRRLAMAELNLGLNQQAIEHARAAHTAANTPQNASSLATALLSLEDPELYAEALSLAREGAAADPDSPFVQMTLLHAGVMSSDEAAIRASVSQLLIVAPDVPVSHYYAGLVAMADERWTLARDEMLKARDLGMPEDVTPELMAEIEQHIRSQQTQSLWLKRLGLAVGGWFGTFALLFAAGLILSRITLVAVRRPHAGERPGTLERGVRGLYAGVIGLTSVFFYLSLPLLAIVIILAAAGLIYLQLRATRINLYILAMTAVVGLYTVLAIVRSIFVRIRESEPGRPLAEAEAPGLWALIREIAARSETRPADAVYLTPGVEVAVMERGGLLGKLRGKGRRYLILGLGALPGMTQGEFAAILAHEYGHFSNRDTAGGNLAYQVNLSMHTMAYNLASRGLATWYNPAWWFINGFSKLFYRTTLGASRLREILADRFAAVTYGAQNLIDGLTRIVRQDLAFDLLAGRTVRESTARHQALPNLYTGLAGAGADAETLESRFAELMQQPTSPYDSHPAVSERIRLIRNLQAPCAACGSDAPARDLFANMAALEDEMMAVVRERVTQGEKSLAEGRAAEFRQLAKDSVPEVAQGYEKLAEMAAREDHAGEAEAWEALAEVYRERGLHARAANCLGTAAACYGDLGDPEGERVARYNRAGILKELDEWEAAEAELRKVVALDETTGSPDLETDRAELEEVAARAAE